MSAGRGGDEGRCWEGFEGREDWGDVAIEGEGFAEADIMSQKAIAAWKGDDRAKCWGVGAYRSTDFAPPSLTFSGGET